jgi:hypothetical protein
MQSEGDSQSAPQPRAGRPKRLATSAISSDPDLRRTVDSTSRRTVGNYPDSARKVRRQFRRHLRSAHHHGRCQERCRLPQCSELVCHRLVPAALLPAPDDEGPFGAAQARARGTKSCADVAADAVMRQVLNRATGDPVPDCLNDRAEQAHGMSEDRECLRVSRHRCVRQTRQSHRHRLRMMRIAHKTARK